MDEQPEIGSAGARFDALREFAARVAPANHESTAELDAATVEVLEAFEVAGVDALLLKGPGLTALLYEPGEERGYSDVDLLVAPRELAAAEDALVQLGYVNAEAVQGIDDVGGVVHGQAWIRSVPGSVDHAMVDLHCWLPGSRAAPARAWEALAARRVWIELGGRRAPVLDRAGQAMHLATHAAQHGPAFAKHVNELGLALERWPAEVWDAAALLASEIGATEVFAAGLRLAPRGAAQASRLRLPATNELDWTIRHIASRPRGTFHLQAFAEAESRRERIAIVRRSLLPTRDWMIHQHPWARRGGLRVTAAYGLHLASAPAWAARAWRFRRRARRAARAR